MRYAKHIAVLLVAMIVATACTMIEFNELEEAMGSNGSNGAVTITARTTHFLDCNVGTRSKKVGDEGKVTSMALAIFPVEGGALGDCVYYKFNNTGSMLFVIERAGVFTTDQPYAMYFFANMQGSGLPESDDEGVGESFSYFTSLTYTLTGGGSFESVPANGFPMVGSLGDTVTEGADGNTFILSPTKGTSNENGLPTINGVPTDNLEIPMKSMFAKFSFIITVKPDQEVVGNAAPRFDLNSYTVNNAPKTLHFSAGENTDNIAADDVVSSGERNFTNNFAQGATTATFEFYIPERFVNPDSFTYPSGMTEDELEKYRQRFKPLLVEGKNATYVTIEGNYTDHQKHVYTVAYDIYLGSNNYNNFDIIRNTHYTNSVTIKGIQTADDQSGVFDPEEDVADQTPVTIDHRVTIARSTPIVVGLKRETLLDAHFEVRPLRLHLSGGPENPTSAVATVTLSDNLDGNGYRWIGMERNDGGSATTTHLASGKRKYFTTDLVSGLTAETLSVDGVNHDANKTIWIYVDENTSTSSRTATLHLNYTYTYINEFGEEKTEVYENDYSIVQHGLHEVTYDGHTYYIERFEEYLYNFDSEDLFGKTDQDGMKWGLDGLQLSYDRMAALPSMLENYNNISENRQNTINGWVDSYYDFYTVKHDSGITTPAAYPPRDRAGLDFCNEIIATTGVNIGELDLSEQPQSAVEYCYNKNKRDSNGNVTEVVWYLPAVDEIEDFIMGAYGDYPEFQDNPYWSCQPAYHRCYFFMSKYYDRYAIGSWVINEGTLVRGNFDFYIDDVTRARSTQVVFEGNDKYNYVRSGIEVPASTQEYRTVGGSSIEFTIQKGYYTWRTNRGGENVENGYSASGVWTNYDYVGAYINSTDVNKRIYPEFGEDPYREQGSKLRTDKARVRCLRKMN